MSPWQSKGKSHDIIPQFQRVVLFNLPIILDMQEHAQQITTGVEGAKCSSNHVYGTLDPSTHDVDNVL